MESGGQFGGMIANGGESGSGKGMAGDASAGHEMKHSQIIGLENFRRAVMAEAATLALAAQLMRRRAIRMMLKSEEGRHHENREEGQSDGKAK